MIQAIDVKLLFRELSRIQNRLEAPKTLIGQYPDQFEQLFVAALQYSRSDFT